MPEEQKSGSIYENYVGRLHAAEKSNSLLKKFLTQDVFEAIKDRKTSFGGSLDLIARSGLENPDSSIGAYASDEDAYHTFSPLFDPIILSYHNLSSGFKHPPLDFGNPKELKDLDPQNKYIISTRVRCARSLKGFPLNSLLTKEQYGEIEAKVTNVLADPAAGIEGEYYSLSSMPAAEKQELIRSHLLFKEGDRFLEAAQASRFWPTGRGIFINKQRTFLVWVNEEDHLRIISMQAGADLAAIYTRLVHALEVLASKIEFSRDDRLGYLTFCPSNIGTTIRASVHIRLPHLARDKARMDEIAGKYKLQIRGTHGEHSDVEGGVFDISNKRRCGLTEFEVVKELQDGILEIIRAEEAEASK